MRLSGKYLGVQLDRRLSFSEYVQIAADKSIQSGAKLAWLMSNIGGPREAKRRLVLCRLLLGASALRPWLFQRVPEALQEERRGNMLLLLLLRILRLC